MIFKQIADIRSGAKTQTRRIVKPNEVSTLVRDDPENETIHSVYTCNNTDTMVRYCKTKWVVGKDYAVIPKRGQPAIKDIRIRITGIRREPVQAISYHDALAEGIHRNSLLPDLPHTLAYSYTVGDQVFAFETPQAAYRALWDSINNRPGIRWEDNPQVWVLTFEVVKLDGAE